MEYFNLEKKIQKHIKQYLAIPFKSFQRKGDRNQLTNLPRPSDSVVLPVPEFE